MKKDIVIYGAGGLSREIAFLIDEINSSEGNDGYRLLGHIVDGEEQTGLVVGRSSIIGGPEWFDERDRPVSVAIAIGTPRVLDRISSLLAGNRNVDFPNLIHPGTVMDRDAVSFGKGNLITAGNILTTDISIGSFNLFNLNCTYGHDTVVGDFCVMNPGCNISGNVTLEGSNLIGTGATILQGITVGQESIVGAGAVVTKNVAQGITVVGVPARQRG